MAAKQLMFSVAARQRMLGGIDVLSNAVRVTLGPKGRTVVLDQHFGVPRITKDGVTVAKDIELEDRYANMGVRLVREVASRTSYKAGDGTTTATVLAHAFVKEGVKLTAAGANPMDLRRGIDAAVAFVVAELGRNSQPITSNEEIAQIGTISANGEAAMGRLIADAMRQVGNDGVITVEQASSWETRLEILEGMQFDRGYISPSFITNPKTLRVELDEPYILVHEGKLSVLREILPLLDQVMETRKPLFIIAEAVEGEVLTTLVVNKASGALPVCAVKAPGHGDRGKALLQDIAIFTGGHAICEELGIKLDHASIRLLGRAKKVTVEKHNATIVAGGGKKTEIDTRIREIKGQINEATSDFDREKYLERIARLAGAVAVIRVGGGSEIEVQERKDRVDDALNATRAAVEEGIVPGGGVALLRAAQALAALEAVNEDQRLGIGIVKTALAYPACLIARNAGADAPLVAAKILADGTYGFGYDARAGEYGDLIARGIIDPTEVVRTALQAAASVAGLLITTEAMITDLHDRVELEGHHHHSARDMDIDF